MVRQGYQLTDEEFMAVSQRLDTLIREFESLPLPIVQEKAFAMLQAIDALHREGLNRLITFLREEGRDEWVDRAAEDPVIRVLLLLYDLVPADSIMPAEIAGEERVADPNGRASTPAQQPFISLAEVKLSRPSRPDLKKPVFDAVARLEELPPGAIQAVAVDNVRALLVNVDGEIYAVGELCPGSQMPLSFGSLEGAQLTCPWHNEIYDVRSGKCLDPGNRKDTSGLPVYPVSIIDREIRIATGKE